LRLPHESIVTGLAFVSRSDTLATVSENGAVRVWDLASGRELWRMEQDGTSYFIAASDSGRYLVSTSGRTARVWDSSKGAELAKLDHSGPVLAARFRADETLLVTFGNDIATTVWELPGGAVRKRIAASAGELAGALFGPDGRTLVIGSTDGTLRWWHLDKDEEQFSVAVGYVLELASSANGHLFVMADNIEKMASTWEFASGRQLRQMPYWGFSVGGVAITSDGRLMASSGYDGRKRILEITEVQPDDPLAYACRKVQRNLTRTEWREYFGADDVYRPTCPQIAAPDTATK
jgi:WD40 repeat protein